MDCTVVGRHRVGKQLSLRKGRGALVVPWSAGVCQRLHWAEREWLGRDRQHLGRSGWPPRSPAENCWSRCSLPASRSVQRKGPGLSQYTPFKSRFWHVVSGRLRADRLPPPAVFPRAAVRLGEEMPRRQPPPLGVIHSAQCPAVWGSPRRTSSPGPSLFFLCQPGSEGESRETKQPVAFCPEFGVELIAVSMTRMRCGIPCQAPRLGVLSSSPVGWLPCWGTPSWWSKALLS